MSITAKTKKTQKQALLSWLKRHPKTGITSLEAAKELNIVCVHKRISELEQTKSNTFGQTRGGWGRLNHKITRTPERTATGSTVTRYKLAR
jgi:hypothetical protein